MRRRARSPRGRPRSGMARLASFGCADADNAIFPMGRDETAVSRSAEGRLVLLDFVSVKGAFTWPAPERFDPGNAEEIASRPVSRVLYGAKRFLAARVMAIPLGRSLPTASGDQPGRRPGDGLAGQSRRVAPIRSCSRRGLPCPVRRRPGGALLPHPFTLAATMACEGRIARRFAFCGAFPGVAPAGPYPAPCLRGARTFLCHAAAAIRPTG